MPYAQSDHEDRLLPIFGRHIVGHWDMRPLPFAKALPNPYLSDRLAVLGSGNATPYLSGPGT
jgi:hypothetical protein